RIQDGAGLGSSAAGTEVASGGVLELASSTGMTITDETLKLLAVGSTLRNVTGSNVWTGNGDITLVGVAEIQKFALAGSAGTFTLTFNGQTTGPLPFNVQAPQVQAALNALSSIGGVGGSVTVTKVVNTYTVTFGGSLAGQNLPIMTAVGSGG